MMMSQDKVVFVVLRMMIDCACCFLDAMRRYFFMNHYIITVESALLEYLFATSIVIIYSGLYRHSWRSSSSSIISRRQNQQGYMNIMTDNKASSSSYIIS